MGAQAGLTYVEVMVAVALLGLALVPAIEALQTGLLAGDVSRTLTEEHYAAQACMEEVLVEPYALLRGAAEAAGNETIATSYSDAAGTPYRCLVFVALYDVENADGDGDAFTVPDPDLDGDGDPYTDYSGTLWVQVEVEGSVSVLQSLTAP